MNQIHRIGIYCFLILNLVVNQEIQKRSSCICFPFMESSNPCSVRPSRIHKKANSSNPLKPFRSGNSPLRNKKETMKIEGYPVEGVSMAGHETCIVFPTLNIAFDIGRCPNKAISQDFLFISHGHMDHIGGLPMYVSTRELRGMNPPTIFVPAAIKEIVERLFEVYRDMNESPLNHKLIALSPGEEFQLRKDLKVRAFKTYHRVPSQGYVIFKVKEKLKQEYVGLPGSEIKRLRLSGVEITDTTTVPEIAFTGDTTSDFIIDGNNIDVMRARVLVMESTYVDSTITVEHARSHGHTHLSEIVSHADRFENKAILLIHFSVRYTPEEIKEAVSSLPSSLAERVFALTEGF